MGGRQTRLMLAALVAGWVCAARTARAAVEPCVNAVKELTCEPMPESAEARRSVLMALDASARTAVAENRRPAAVRFFGCLLLADPRPENAGNLAVVLKQSGALPTALDAAVCAERLAPPDSANAARARARRMEIESILSELRPPLAEPIVVLPTVAPAPVDRRPLTAGPAAASQPPIAGLPLSATPSTPAQMIALREPMAGGESRPSTRVLDLASSCSPNAPHDSAPPSPPPSTRRFNRAFVGSVVAAILGTGVGAMASFVAHARASQFDEEQSANGATTRAMDLKSGAEMWQVTSIGGFLVAGVAGMTAAILW